MGGLRKESGTAHHALRQRASVSAYTSGPRALEFSIVHEPTRAVACDVMFEMPPFV